jgi:hypothetical protein
MSRIVIVILIYHCHKPINSINLLGSKRRRNVFPVSCGQTYRVEMSFKIKGRMMDNVKNCDSYINIPSSQTYRYH